MADRKQSVFRFWTTRRAIQTPTPPPTPDSNKPPPTEVQTGGQPSTTTNEKKSPSSSKPTSSPSRPTPQSRSPPPQPSSPSRSTPRARPITYSSPSRNSKTPSTPKRPPLPRSLSRSNSKETSSNSPDERQINSPSKEESRHVAQEETPRPLAAVKADGVGDEIDGADRTSSKRNVAEEMPSKSTELGNTTTPTTQSIEKDISSENLENPTSNYEHETLVRGETTYMKEVNEEAKVEANEETKKEVNDFLDPKSGSQGPITEKPDITSRRNDARTEKQEVFEGKKNSPTSQLKKRNAIAGKSGASNKDIRDDISKFVDQTATGYSKNASTDRHTSIITLAGENRGASMQMTSNSREGRVHINRGYKIKTDEGDGTTDDRDGCSKGKKEFENAKSKDDQSTNAYVNNNVQGINNSIVFNASIKEGSPGVHLVVTHVRKEPIESADKTSPIETRKPEFNMSRAEKHTYEPTVVRRRCLRGLLNEKSDSDPENPEKPRRHGCRVGLPKRK